jgi:tetratricopeptide (TPR) repeat protein
VRRLQPTIPLDLETICLKAMSKEPTRRYPDCAAMEADLRRFLRNEPIVARPIGGIERSIRWCRRNPRIAVPIATAIFSVLTALSVSVWSAVTLAKKNADIEQQKNLAVKAKILADENAEIAERNAFEAEQNFKLARERAIQSKNSILQMLLVIRKNIPSTEKKLRPVREQLLQVASNQLDLLPDESDDSELRTGLEKARVLQERYLTALELGQPSKAIEYLDTAEEILRKRNASQSTDVTRLNLTTLLHHQAHTRSSIHRNMERVRELGEESLQILRDILAHPRPEQFDVPHGSVPRIDTLTQVMVQGYQHALTLKKLGRVKEGFDVIDLALNHFDEAMNVLRNGPFQQLNDEEWARQKQLFRGMVAEQDQLRTSLLGSIGRDQEAVSEQSRILENMRKIADDDKSRENWAKLSLALMFAGDLARQRGHVEDALELYEESVKITRALYQDDPSLEDRRNRHQISLSRLAGLLRSRDLNRARQLYVEAQQVAQEMVRADSDSIIQHIALALVSPFSDSPDSAVEQAEDILKRSVPGDAEMFIDLARVWSASAESDRLSPSPDSEKIERWKQEALKMIEDAVALGYRDRSYLMGEPDFDAIKSEEKFQELLRKCADGT